MLLQDAVFYKLSISLVSLLNFEFQHMLQATASDAKISHQNPFGFSS